MSRWFRFYDEALNDKKVQRLAPHLFKTWINLLCLASKSKGKLPCDDDISFELRISVQDARQQLEDLVLAGLVDIMPDGSREPHNWQERQFTSDTSQERTRKYRERLKGKSCDVTVTPDVTTPESESYSDTDTKPKGLPSSLEPARGIEDLKGFKNVFGMKDDRKKEKLVCRAEGLGIDVEEVTKLCKDHGAKNRPAYFTALCVQRLQKGLPGLDEAVIRAALWDKGDDAYKTVLRLIMEAA